MRVKRDDGWLEIRSFASDNADFTPFLTPPAKEPITPRLAATVMLVRDHVPGDTPYEITAPTSDVDAWPKDYPNNQNVEVFLMRRAKTMEFVPDVVVFPGGGVDATDNDPRLPWVGPTPEQWSEWMHTSVDDARRLVVAAAREVFEETGVLLAGPNETELISDLNDPVWQNARERLSKHEITFAEFLIDRGLVLRSDLLGLMANFCTPPHVTTKRYDTFFFSALMPEGQVADGKTTEAQIAGWVTPSYAQLEADRGKWKLLAPTTYNLLSVAEAKNAEDFVSTRNYVEQMIFKAKPDADGELYLYWNRPTD